jgi:hypothetical protein
LKFAAILFPLATACHERAVKPKGELQSLARIELDSNRVAEIVGLRWWTPDMLQDSLAKYAPGRSLDDPDVAPDLRYKLHFADAAVFTSEQVFDQNETRQYTIAVREPSDSSRVHYVAQTLDSAASLAAWRPLTSRLAGPAHAHLLDVVTAAHLEGPPRTVVDSADRAHPVTSQLGYAFESAADSLEARPILDALARMKSDGDFTTAATVIQKSTSEIDRVVAALVLSNFPDRDPAWHLLLLESVAALQRADAATAWQALEAMSERFPRVVDWTPVAPRIRDVLDGTALAALPSVASALGRTGVSSKDAHAFLAGGGEMITALLESDNSDLSEPAHRLLVALRGSDLGGDVEAWRAWIRTL